ncbi:MAG: site-specific integrase [Gaiellaceae bacterium]
MSRQATGQVLERTGKGGRTYALRFRALGARQYETLGSASEGWTRERAQLELENVLADVRRGIWRPPETEPALEVQREEPTFHEFASEWLEARRPELGDRTYEDYKWALTSHLLPFFATHRLSEITAREIDRYRATKMAEGDLCANTVNKTLTRLSQILALAAEYELIPGNPAAGKRRRAKGTKPRRPWVSPEQLPTLLDAADGAKPLLGGRGRPLLAVLAGAGLRIDEALSLERRHVNLARGTLTIERSKTEAGVRVTELPPSVRDELATYLNGSKWKKPTDLVFPTSSGHKDNRQNIRQRLFMKAIERANVRLAELGIEQLGDVRPHGLRRTYASLRCACGDDPVFVSRQIGHEDVRFTLNVYAQSVKRRERMTEAERDQYDRAIEWASWASEAPSLGTSAQSTAPVPVSDEVASYAKGPAKQGLCEDGRCQA